MNDTATSSGETIATDTALPQRFRPLRTWPAVVLVVLMFCARYGPARFEEDRLEVLDGGGIRTDAVLPAHPSLVAGCEQGHLA